MVITENGCSSETPRNMKLITFTCLVLAANCLPQRNLNSKSNWRRIISKKHQNGDSSNLEAVPKSSFVPRPSPHVQTPSPYVLTRSTFASTPSPYVLTRSTPSPYILTRSTPEPYDVSTRSNPVPIPVRVAPNRKPTEWELEQNRNAHYKFSTNIDDKISDQTQQRNEVREGLKVEGSYSYSDGFFFRSYHYIADDKGYRITSAKVVPLTGPQVNLEGTASVDAAAHGTQVSYRVQSVPAVGQKIIDKI